MNRALSAGKMASAGVDQLIELINHQQMERVRNLIKPHATAARWIFPRGAHQFSFARKVIHGVIIASGCENAIEMASGVHSAPEGSCLSPLLD
jgi:hypothetical protein